MLKRLGWTRWALLASGVAVIAGSCKGATEITVQVTTNAACDASAQADRFSQLGISVGTPGKVQAQAPAGTSQACKTLQANLGLGYGPNDLGTLVLAPAHAKDEGVEVVAVAAILPVGGQSVDLRTCETWVDTGQPAAGFRNYSDPDDGRPLMPCLVARRSLSFASSTNLQLPIQLDVTCTGVVCSPGSTCVNKMCVSDKPPSTTCNDMNPNCSLSGGGGASSTTSAVTTNVSTGTGPGSTSTGTITTATGTTGVSTTSATTSQSSTNATSTTATGCTGTCPAPCGLGNACNPATCACECDPNTCGATPGCMCAAIAVLGGPGSGCLCTANTSSGSMTSSSSGPPPTSSSSGPSPTSSSTGVSPPTSSSSGMPPTSSSSGGAACAIQSTSCQMCTGMSCQASMMACFMNVTCSTDWNGARTCACNAQMSGNLSGAQMCMSNFASAGSQESAFESCVVNNCGAACGF